MFSLCSRYDFFVVSQHVRQGTVSPTHYIVVHDEVGLPPERMQILSYKLTHLYYNWPGTVRVPAPCLVSPYKHFLSIRQSLRLLHVANYHSLHQIWREREGGLPKQIYNRVFWQLYLLYGQGSRLTMLFCCIDHILVLQLC